MPARLFDPAATQPIACPVRGCSAMLTAGQQKTPTCVHDLDPYQHVDARGAFRRPRGCLNAATPTDEIPY